MQGEIGCAGHIGRVVTAAATRTNPDSSLQSSGVSCDAKLPIASWLEVRGEAYTGKLLRGLGGAAIGQGIIAGHAVENTAGWGQINAHTMSNVWSGGVGCGIDPPRDQDLDSAARRRNTTCALYAIARSGGPVFVGAEARQTETRYLTRAFKNTHLNLSFGFEF
jgi:hypothetical protein